MRILTTQHKGAVVLVLPDGKTIEITMISAQGDDVYIESDVQQAIKILQEHADIFGITDSDDRRR